MTSKIWKNRNEKFRLIILNPTFAFHFKWRIYILTLPTILLLVSPEYFGPQATSMRSTKYVNLVPGKISARHPCQSSWFIST